MSIAKLEPGWPFQENKLQYDIWDKSDKVQTEWIQIWHISSILMKKRQNTKQRRQDKKNGNIQNDDS